MTNGYKRELGYIYSWLRFVLSKNRNKTQLVPSQEFPAGSREITRLCDLVGRKRVLEEKIRSLRRKGDERRRFGSY